MNEQGWTGSTASEADERSKRNREEGENMHCLENKSLGTPIIPSSGEKWPGFNPAGFNAVISTLTCSRRSQ